MIQSIFAAILVAVTFMSSLAIMGHQTKLQKQANYHVSLTALRWNTHKTLRNTQAWSATLDDSVCNPGMSCLKTGTCTGNHERPINCLYDVSGTALFFDSRIADAGFDSAGRPCTGYSAAGNPLCPFRPTLTWKPACSGGSCSTIELSVKFAYSNPSTPALNTTVYDIAELK